MRAETSAGPVVVPSDGLSVAARCHGISEASLIEAAFARVLGQLLGQSRVAYSIGDENGGFESRLVFLDPPVTRQELAKLLEAGPESDANPASGVRLVLRSIPRPQKSSLIQTGHEKTALQVEAALEGGEIRLTASTDGRLADRWTTARLLEHLRRALGDWDSAIEGSLLTPEERQRLLVDWNPRAVAYRPDACVHTLFEEQAALNPASPAVLSSSTNLSYGELDQRANQLAHHLIARGVYPGAMVGVCLERSPEVVVSILAILKAGAAYLPLDPAYPAKRLAFMLEDAGAPVVLSRSSLAEPLPVDGARLVLLDQDQERIGSQPHTKPAVVVSSSDLAYVMYTSGSTGEPKGVEIRHRSITRLVCQIDYAKLGPDRTVLHAAPLAFDASTFEIWGPLLNGGRCAIHPEPVPTARGLGDSIHRHGVTTLWLTSALFNAVIDDDPSQLAGVDELLTGGEALSVAHVRRAQQALPTVQLVNGYGPTESTTFTTCYRIPRDLAPDLRSIPIGRPIRETSLYVLDEAMQLVPLGAVGELFIGGEGLARGYHRRPELTAQRFVPSPFEPARLYRTGDLVRWRDEGILEFVGRRDDQVKIRGFRIEPGEIEVALGHHPAVKRCTVQVREDRPGDKRLVAYLVAHDGVEPPVNRALRGFLLEGLPPHMIPAAFVWLPSLPVSANGKVDRKALPEPPAERPETDNEYVAPSGALEQRIAETFASILGIERVGARDGFFEIGGDSILALRVISRLSQEHGLEVPVVNLFQHTTPEALARHCQQTTRSSEPDARPRGQRRSTDVAVVGMAGRFPGANTVEQLWKNLCQGVDSISYFTDAELDPAIPAPLRADPSYVKARGIVEDVDRFDAAFFGVSPKEAEMMDPQQRVLLEVAWEALERAGHVPNRFPGAVGIFAGKYFDFYYDRNLRSHPELVDQHGELNTMVGNDKHFIATRLAHKLNLTGPALSIHSACSTSLVAICQAVQSLRNGECDLALAGGSSITVPVKSGYLYQEGSMLSPDGHCRPFDARASGTTFSDGVALVVLRRLDEALADGDTVYAVIRGVAVNNDGANRASYTAPSVDGQAAVVTRALADGGVEPRSISYVETHGTATPLGDPIEVEALTKAFRATTRDTRFCAIGSVKSNVGHLVIAAGATGLIKTALALHQRQLPPTAHYQSPNPHIDFERSPFYVQASLSEWTAPSPRRAGVSAFGVGGTNAHVILEEPPARAEPGPARSRQLLLLSARTATALEAATARLREHLSASPSSALADVAFTLQAGRQDFAHRRCLVCSDVADAVTGLDPSAKRLQSRHLSTREPSVIFMFPGQGSQYVDMAVNLYSGEPVFRAAVDRCAEALRVELDRDLREVLYPTGDPTAAAALLQQTAFTQPALFTIEYALAELWRSWGVHPEATIGHSVGEFVSAVLAQVMSVEEAVQLVAARGRLMQALPGGSMLSVNLSAEEAERRIQGRPQLAVATNNAPQLCVVAGPTPEIEALQRQLEAEGLGGRLLVTSHAFHSPMMDAAVEPFERLVRRVRLSPPKLPFVSTVSGTWITDAEATDPRYWAGHLRATVRFAAGARTLLERPERLLLEVGPRATLAAMVRRQVKDPAKQSIVSTLSDTSEGGADYTALMQAVGQLWMAGVPLDWKAFHLGEQRRRVVLPTYPFERKRFWIDPAATAPAAPSRSASLSTVSPEPAPLPPTNQEQPVSHTSQPTPSQRRIAALRGMFEEVTGLDLSDADPTANFVDLGLDSLFLTQAALQIQKRFGVKVTFRQLMESFFSLQALATHLDAQLPPEESGAPPTAPAEARAAAQTAAVPSAAVVSAATALPATSSIPGTVQYVIDQQLRLMAQQLALLGVAAPQPTTPTPQLVEQQQSAPQPGPRNDAPAANTPGAGPSEELSPNGQQKYDPKKAFGAIARIHTSTSAELTPKQRARLDALTRRYTARTKESKRLTQLNRPHLADPRVVTGFKPSTKELTYQIVVNRSSGSHLWDVDGNRYVDALCGFGSCFFGWQPPFVTEAVKRQLDAGHEIGPMTPLAGEVAKLVCELTGFERAGFCNTGSEAVMGTMRVARTVTGRSTIALFGGSYHGIFDEVIVRGTKKLKAIPAAPGILPNASQNVLVLDYGTPESLEIIRQRASELAAVLVEPIQSRRPELRPREFLQQVRAITEQAGAALVFDEVVNGFRTGPGGAQEYYGIRADLGAYGKVVGGGFPIGIIAGSRQWADALDGGAWQFGDDSAPTVGVTYFAGTFCRHPLALSAAKAVLEHLKASGPSLQREMNQKTDWLASELNGWFDKVKAPIHVNHFSSLWRPVFTQDLPLSELLFVYLRDRGLHIMEGFPCFLTTAHSQTDLDFIVKVFKESVTEMQEAGFLPEPPAEQRSVDPNEPPVPGARLGRDRSGKPTWYVPHPSEPGKYLPLEVE